MLAYHLIILQLVSICLGASERESIVPSACENYDQDIYADLDSICRECQQKDGRSMTYVDCKKDCFSSEIFNSCIETYQSYNMTTLMRNRDILKKGDSLIPEVQHEVFDFGLRQRETRMPKSLEEIDSNSFKEESQAPTDCKIDDSIYYSELDDTCKSCQESCKGGQIYSNCKKNCFVNEFFDGCIKQFHNEERRKLLKYHRDVFNNSSSLQERRSISIP